MPDDTITLISTTDTAEQVQEALTNKPAEKPEKKSAETPAEKPEEAATEAPPPAETPEQKDERETKEASEAGGRLAKRKKSIQDEIDDLTRSKHNVRRDVEAEEARLYEIRRQREQLEAQKPPDTPAAKAPDEKPDEGRPEPKLDAVDAAGNAKYATYADYLSDHTAWGREEASARRVR
jgi:hypothetical protein